MRSMMRCQRRRDDAISAEEDEMFIDAPWLAPVLIAVIFVALWIAIVYAVGNQIGWPVFAQHYRATQPFSGFRVHVRRAQFGRRLLGGVNNAINLGVNGQGIEIRMFFLFRFNCPTLFVPWSDIRVGRGKFWIMRYVEFEFLKVPGSSMRIFGKAAQRIEDAAGTAWPERGTAGAFSC
jgi:small-conductance mechanosensitive channel